MICPVFTYTCVHGLTLHEACFDWKRFAASVFAHTLLRKELIYCVLKPANQCETCFYRE